MNIRACIFDLDGTLLNTLEDLANAANASLAEAGHPTHPLDAYRTFVGDGVFNLFRRALPATLTETEKDTAVADLVPRFERIYATCWHAITAPYPGIGELIAILRSRGLPLAILSNKPHPFTVEMVNHFFPRDTFTAVFGARPHVARKPAPAAALEVAALLGVTPAEVLFVGDSNTDMRTAANAGMPSAGCIWGFRGEAELRAAGATLLLQTPADLPDYIA